MRGIEVGILGPLPLDSAKEATAPASEVALAKYEGAKVSEQVASHTNSLPRSQGTIVMPSGLLPSFLYIPAGSSRDGILAADKAR